MGHRKNKRNCSIAETDNILQNVLHLLVKKMADIQIIAMKDITDKKEIVESVEARVYIWYSREEGDSKG